jgi:hypothetical protein
MRITAKFDSRCISCGKAIKKGDAIEYLEQKAYHIDCAPQEDQSPSAEQLALADRLGFSHLSWSDLLDVLGKDDDGPERDGETARGRNSIRGVSIN